MEKAQLRLSLAKVTPYVEESVRAYGYLRMDTIPLPGWAVEILANEVVVGSTSTDVEGNFSTFVSFKQIGSFRVRARVLMLKVESNVIDVAVSPAPPLPPPPPPVVVVRPEVRVVELRADEFEAVFRRALREELPAVVGGMKELYGIRPDYFYRSETLAAKKFIDIDVVKELGRVAKEGYLINDHDTESLWISVNEKTPAEVKGGESYPLYKRDASNIKIENKTAVGISLRLELR